MIQGRRMQCGSFRRSKRVDLPEPALAGIREIVLWHHRVGDLRKGRLPVRDTVKDTVLALGPSTHDVWV